MNRDLEPARIKSRHLHRNTHVHDSFHLHTSADAGLSSPRYDPHHGAM